MNILNVGGGAVVLMYKPVRRAVSPKRDPAYNTQLMQNQKPGIYLTDKQPTFMTPPLPKHMEMYRPGSSNVAGSSSNNIFKPMQQFLEATSPMGKPPVGMGQCSPQLVSINHSNSMNRLSMRGENTSKSQSKLDGNSGNSASNQIETALKELKQRMYKMGKTLYEHDRVLSEIRGQKLYNSTVSGSTVNQSPLPPQSGPSLFEISKLIQQQLEFQRQNAHTKILTSIDELRREISDKFVRKEDYQLNFFGELQEIRNKIHEGDKLVMEALRREVDSVKLGSYDRGGGSLHLVEKQVMELRKQVDLVKTENISLRVQLQQQQKQQQSQQSFLTTNRRFNSPRILRYRQTLQSLTSNFDPMGEEITINQMIYYLDRDGYLLDKNYCYLVDRNNNPIQLEQRHLNLLHSHSLMF